MAQKRPVHRLNREEGINLSLAITRHHFVFVAVDSVSVTVSHIVPFVTNRHRKYKSLQTLCFLKLRVKQNSAIGASAPVVDPVVQLTRWIAIRRDLLKSLLPDTVQVEQHPEKGY